MSGVSIDWGITAVVITSVGVAAEIIYRFWWSSYKQGVRARRERRQAIISEVATLLDRMRGSIESFYYPDRNREIGELGKAAAESVCPAELRRSLTELVSAVAEYGEWLSEAQWYAHLHIKRECDTRSEKLKTWQLFGLRSLDQTIFDATRKKVFQGEFDPHEVGNRLLSGLNRDAYVKVDTETVRLIDIVNSQAFVDLSEAVCALGGRRVFRELRQTRDSTLSKIRKAEAIAKHSLTRQD